MPSVLIGRALNRRRVRAALLTATAAVTWTTWLAPARADGPCVAGPGQSCQLPCHIGGSPTIARGTGAGSVGATITGCGTGPNDCSTTCESHGSSTTGNWTAYGGARGMTMQTVRQSTGSPK